MTEDLIVAMMKEILAIQANLYMKASIFKFAALTLNFVLGPYKTTESIR